MIRLLPAFLSLLLLPALAYPAESAAPLFSASNVVGAPVTNLQGVAAGTLRDLAIDASSGAIAYAIVDFKGPAVQNVGLRNVPVAAFRGGLEHGRLALDPAPYLSWNAQPPARPWRRVVLASTLFGMPVDDAKGVRYGSIKDVLLGLRDATVREATVSLERPAAGEAEVAFSALRFPPESGAAVVQLSLPGDRAARGG